MKKYDGCSGGMSWAWRKLFKGESDRKKGINNKANKAVIQMTLNGMFIARHHSSYQAERVTDCHQRNISACCRGVRNKCGGFRWMHSIGSFIANNIA